MNYFSQIFQDYMSLSVGTNSENFREYKDFFHIQSIFDSEWYNFVVPKLKDPSILDMEEVSKLIDRENSCGKKVSFYINQTFLSTYQTFLERNGYQLSGDEIYLLKNLDSIKTVALPPGYTIDSKYNLKEVIEVLEQCFPDWPEENIYSEIYEKYKKDGQKDRLFETMVIHFENRIIGASSVSLDKNLNLGYFHNDGVSELHRRKGLHTALIDERCSFCFKNGVNRALSIVDEGANSYPSYLKNGFEIADKFLVFTKTNP